MYVMIGEVQYPLLYANKRLYHDFNIDSLSDSSGFEDIFSSLFVFTDAENLAKSMTLMNIVIHHTNKKKCFIGWKRIMIVMASLIR